MNRIEKFANWPTLILISIPFLFTGLGSYGLLETSEARYAEISWEMIRSGDWVTPRYNFIKHFHKTPLVYWITGASMKAFGETEFAVRAPQALWGLAGIFLTFHLGRILFDKITGFLSGLVLLATLEYFFISRYLITDMLLTLFITMSLFFYCRGLTNRGYWWCFFLCLAGAFLAKGPIGVLLPGLIIAVDLILAGQGRSFFKLGWGKGFFIILAMALPWFILVCVNNPGLLDYFVFHQTLDRFLTTTHARGGPFYYFLPTFLIGFLPWTLLLPDLARKYCTFKKDPEKAPLRFLTIWVLAPLIFFSFSGSKLVNYILPVFPATALLAGKMWKDAMENNLSLRVPVFLYMVGLAMLLLLLLAFLAQTGTFSGYAEYDLSPVKRPVLILSLLAVAGLAVTLHSLKTGSSRFFFPAILIGTLIGYQVIIRSIASIEPLVSPTRLFVKKISEEFEPGDMIVNFRCLINGLPFYTGQRIVNLAHHRETQFEDDRKETERFYSSDPLKLKELLHSHKGIFLVIKRRHYKEVMELTKRPLRVLAENRSYVLFTDKN